ncbi:MAG: DUF4856 domain-containing protein [Bacteroidota bacterium]
MKQPIQLNYGKPNLKKIMNTKKKILQITLGFQLLLLLLGCSSDDNDIEAPSGPMVNIPTLNEVITGDDFFRTANGDYINDYIDNYSTLFTREGSSTVSFNGPSTLLKQVVELGGDLGSQVEVATIQLKFEGQNAQSAGFSDTSLNGTMEIVRFKTSSSIAQFGGFNSSGQGQTNVSAIAAFIAGHQAVMDNWVSAAASGQPGRFADSEGITRHVDAKGRELNQLFTKSLTGALAYDQAVNHYLNRLDDENNGTGNYRTLNDEGTVVEGSSYTTMEHHWDEAFGCVYGNTLSQNLIYKYIDDVDGLSKFAGTESDIFTAFVVGRIAIAEKDYATRDAQIGILREKLGLIIAVRAVHHLSAAAKIIDAINGGGAGKREDAFHDISQGYGFVNSLRYLVNASGSRYFTDAEVNNYLMVLDVGNAFWDSTSTQLTDLANVIAAKGAGGLSWTPDDVHP